jgi:hypothetical protein
VQRLRNPALLGDLLVVAFALVLVLAVVHRAELVTAAAHHHASHALIRPRL